jgi:hypothetical protein
MIKKITQTIPEFVAFLATLDNPQPVGVTALTEAETVGNPPWPILKLSRFGAFVGDYENMVNNQLGREGKGQLTFTAKPRKWGHHISLALVEHIKKGDTSPTFYASLKPLHARKPVYLVRTPEGFLAPIAKTAIAQWLKPEAHAKNQGTVKEIYHRDFKLTSIVSFRSKHQEIRIRAEDRAAAQAAKPVRQSDVRRALLAFIRALTQPSYAPQAKIDTNGIADDDQSWDAHKLA